MKLLLVDSNYLCYKAVFTMIGLSHQEYHTGVIFGFLREVQKLAEDFEGYQFVFVWDSKKSYRKEVYPDYKKKTALPNPEIEQLITVGKPQFAELRLKVLPRLGFKNNLIETGIEADDIIAHIVRDYSWDVEDIVIISADEDLYQCLHNNVRMYNPKSKEFYSLEDFTEEKGILPTEWPMVKAIAGCSSDNVKGIPGIGEKTALKFLRNELPMGKKLEAIRSFNPSFNLSLVKLPHEKSYPLEIQPDNLNFNEFEGVCLDYGFQSFLKKEVYNKWRGILCL